MATKEQTTQFNEPRGVRRVIRLMFSGFVMEHYGSSEKPKEQVASVVVSSAQPSATENTDVLSTVSGPRVYALPNSPTGWNESSHEALLSFVRQSFDPGRPESLIEDGIGLGTDEKSPTSAKR